jgi:hypothetical protein
LAKHVARDLASLGHVVRFADAFEEMELIHFIDMILLTHREGVGTYLGYFDQKDESASTVLNHVSFDWNVVLLRGNNWYDRISAAFKLPKHGDRVRELSNLEAELQALAAAVRSPGVWLEGSINRRQRSESLAAAIITQFAFPLSRLLEIEDQAASRLHGLQLTAALAAYRAEHGKYPDRLDQLVPAIVPKLPDLRTAAPLKYERDGDSYILSSGDDDIVQPAVAP